MTPKTPALGPRMRPDASKRKSVGKGTNKTPSLRLCGCGCGEHFSPIRHQRFLDDAHRKRAWIANNSGPMAISQIRARLRAIESKLGIKKGG